MSMIFDPLEYYEQLKSVNVPEDQARIQANALRDFARAQTLRDGELLATKNDIAEINANIREVELRLQKWQWGIGLALAAIMAKGFGWLGF